MEDDQGGEVRNVVSKGAVLRIGGILTFGRPVSICTHHEREAGAHESLTILRPGIQPGDR